MSNATLYIKGDFVDKFYTNSKKNRLSSVKMELAMIDQFKSRHAPRVVKRHVNGYRMVRYNYNLGNGKKLKRVCPDFMEEINEIEKDLMASRINHRDINPGNLLYSEKEHTLKLIDFYWALPLEMEEPRVGKLNRFYGSDKKAFERLRKEYGKNYS